MQEIINLLSKLQNGEIKKYSLLRIAIANYYEQRGIEKSIEFDIRTFEGKQQLLKLASQLATEYEAESEIDAFVASPDEIIKEATPKSSSIPASINDLNAGGLRRFGLEADFMIGGKQIPNPQIKILNLDIFGGILGAKDIPFLKRLCACATEFVDEEGSKRKKIQPDEGRLIGFMKSCRN